jgi:hypothetical protein
MMTNSNQGPVRDRSRLQSLAMIAIFDVAGPLVAYQLLRSAGQSEVSALILSGILPALGIVINLIRRRRIDAVGILVLAGIAIGTILGVVTHDPKLVLMEGSVPTAVFGLVCLGSLWTSRPLIYRFALEFMGEESPRGQEFSSLWQYPAFRHIFNVFTVVWGVTYLAEAGARVALVELTSTSTALTVSKFMPYVVAGALVLWMTSYGRRAKRRGEAQQTAAQQTAAQQTAAQQTAAQQTVPESAAAQQTDASLPSSVPGPRRPVGTAAHAS